jgi:hypothetical protein
MYLSSILFPTKLPVEVAQGAKNHKKEYIEDI